MSELRITFDPAYWESLTYEEQKQRLESAAKTLDAYEPDGEEITAEQAALRYGGTVRRQR